MLFQLSAATMWVQFGMDQKYALEEHEANRQKVAVQPVKSSAYMNLHFKVNEDTITIFSFTCFACVDQLTKILFYMGVSKYCFLSINELLYLYSILPFFWNYVI